MKFIYMAKLLHIVYDEYMILPAEDIGLRLGSLDLASSCPGSGSGSSSGSGFGIRAWMNK